ncbi:hypothetical protein WJX73_009040 [Symbiochloris irregularis]|uniref:Armadillo repeat-containing protein 6 n=1 Tax=Symbiochloris irregularis TaxID=706552 RepID=A0AAW1PRQ1_9CHLO
MPAPRTISQEAFNAAVKDNIDEFEMEGDEAVKSAVEEFELQGIDLSGLVLSANAASCRHPAEEAAMQLKASLEGDGPALSKSLAAFLAAVDNTDAKLQLTAATVAQRTGVLPPLQQYCLAESSSDVHQRSTALRALACLLTCPEARDELAAKGSCTKLCRLLADTDDVTLATAAATALSAATSKNETNKAATVDADLGPAVQHVLALPSCTDQTVAAICELLRRCCNADDDRPIVSRAFQNGRNLGSQGVPISLLSVLQRMLSANAAESNGHQATAATNGNNSNSINRNASEADEDAGTAVSASPASVQAAVCSALKWMVVNEEICKGFSDAGGVRTALQVLQQGLGRPGVVRTSAALLRQLAGSDVIKDDIIRMGALETVTRAARMHIPHLGALEQVLGLLAALTLRNPSGGDAAMEAGCIDAALEVMGATMNRAPAAQWAQRQACQSVRNVAGRGPELRPAIIAKGAESLLRASGAKFPAACQDVSSAALRDLGFEKYQT